MAITISDDQIAGRNRDIMLMMKKDVTTKEVIKTIAEDIAIYILKLNITDVDFIDKEFQRIKKREADVVALCEIDGVKSVFHLEIQNNNDATMHRRMLRYYVEIAMEFPDLPIQQYVIYIGKAALTMQDAWRSSNLDFAYTLIDMHAIDCDELIRLGTPDALVLSILCDFKGRDEKEMLFEIAKRLKTMTGEDERLFSQKMLMMEVLSENRNLQKTLEEVEEMLRNITLEQLPSYGIGMKRGIEEGKLEGKLETACLMIREFGLTVKEVADKLSIPAETLEEYLRR